MAYPTTNQFLQTPFVDLVGTPFRYGGRGPTHFDCYGLVLEMFKRAGVENVPDYGSAEDIGRIAAMMNSAELQWKKLDSPRPGALVFVRIGRFNAHVGFCLDGNRMIHTWERSGGVVIERLETWRRQIVGYYEYVG